MKFRSSLAESFVHCFRIELALYQAIGFISAMLSSPVLAVVELKEVTDIDVQLWHFVIRAAIVIIISWVWIRMHRWLALLAMATALWSAASILHDLWWTESWLDRSNGEQLVPGYVPAGLGAAIAPIVAITFLLLIRTTDRKRPAPPFLRLAFRYVLGIVSVVASLDLVVTVLSPMLTPTLASFPVDLLLVIGLWLSATYFWFRTATKPNTSDPPTPDWAS